jgi:hypothetical protein
MAGAGPPGADPPYPVDPRVDAYIDALPGWQQAICRIPAAPLTVMFRQIIANNRAGGWRRLSAETDCRRAPPPDGPPAS